MIARDFLRSNLNLGRTIFNICFWSVIFVFVLAVRYYDIGNIAFIQLPVQIPSFRIFGNGIILGVLVGAFYSIVEKWLDSTGLYNNTIGKILLLRTFYLFLVSSGVLSSIAYINYLFDIEAGNISYEIGYGKYIGSATVRFLFMAALLGNITLSVLHTLKSKIGDTEFVNLLLGYYRLPKEEIRVFMFLDLKSSTTVAESLGHHKYSQLIQNCFNDLTESVMKTKAEIYQYVGDEVVLTWPVEIGLLHDNCLKIFYLYRQKLESKKDFYLQEFSWMPEFKAGVSMGKVTVVEVGVLKRAIVYHSDVLNTAARIQSLCNQYERQLLVSEDVKNNLISSDYSFELVDETLLRGKTMKVRIYGVTA